MTAYYNEIDPHAAQWLRNLIDAGHIAPGHVDERSIEDVKPSELTGYTQCHFFAGIGIWSLALRTAGWPDNRPVWTGSCPCQPFSAAGKGGGFDDERHLWPAWYRLIDQCRPVAVLGEQVASKDGLSWFDLVQADMENTGYACGGVDICAAGFGAPHIRQRLYFGSVRLGNTSGSRTTVGVPETMGWVEGFTKEYDHGGGGLLRSVAGGPEPSWLADDDGQCSETFQNVHNAEHHVEPRVCPSGSGGNHTTGPTNGFWRDVDWLGCRDGKFRPVRPGTFPLVDGATARVGRLRAYGNGLVAPQAAEFVRAFMNYSLRDM